MPSPITPEQKDEISRLIQAVIPEKRFGYFIGVLDMDNLVAGGEGEIALMGNIRPDILAGLMKQIISAHEAEPFEDREGFKKEDENA